jgi:hypothetical protein
MAHLIGLNRDEFDHMLGSFYVLARKEMQTDREYRTSNLVLDRYEALGQSIAGGGGYESPLDPPPAHPSVAHFGVPV